MAIASDTKKRPIKKKNFNLLYIIYNAFAVFKNLYAINYSYFFFYPRYLYFLEYYVILGNFTRSELIFTNLFFYILDRILFIFLQNTNFKNLKQAQ